VLDEHFPGWKTKVAGTAETQGLVADFLANEVHFAEDSAGGKLRAAPKDGKIIIRDFFSYPQIIREEIVYYCWDLLQKQSKSSNFNDFLPNPRRKVIRIFCKGGQKSADLGAVELFCENGNDVSIGLKKKPVSDTGVGFAVLINLEGNYIIEKTTFFCAPAQPFVLRSCTKEDFSCVKKDYIADCICAENQNTIFALICLKNKTFVYKNPDYDVDSMIIIQ
jgi:hypothetical protein